MSARPPAKVVLLASLAIGSAVAPAAAGAKPDHGAGASAPAKAHGHGPTGQGPPGQVKHAPDQPPDAVAASPHHKKDAAVSTAVPAPAGALSPATPAVPILTSGAAASAVPIAAAPEAAPVGPPVSSTPAIPPPAAKAPVGPRRVAGHHRRHRHARRGGTAISRRRLVRSRRARHQLAARRSARRAASARPRTIPSKRRSAAPPAHRAASGFAAPLTHTVTRIIGVLPRPLRWALAALVALALLLATAIVWMALRARRLRRRGRRLAADVGLLESTLIPAVPEQVGPAAVSAAHRSEDELAAGGDFYDAFELDAGRMGLVMGDVEGHGRTAIGLTAAVRYTLRAYLEAGLAPRIALRVASGALGHTLGRRLVTAVAAVYDSRAGTLTFACAGHPAPLLLGAALESPIACSSPPIGAQLTTGGRQVTTSLAPECAAVFYTDGAVDPRIDRSGVALDRLVDALAGCGPEVAADDLLARLLDSAQMPDDTSACVLRPLPGAAAGSGEHIEEIEFDRFGLAGSGERFLAACGVAPPQRARAMRLARPIAEARGSVVLTIRRSGSSTDVTAAPPAPVSLTAASLSAA